MAYDGTSFHSVYRWTFNAGKGGFVPASMRPEWHGSRLDTAGVIRLIKKEIAPRMPSHVHLGFEMHYNIEVDEPTAAAVSDALGECQMRLGMITPGAHSHFGYGGICSLDPRERKMASTFGTLTVDLAYGVLRRAWHPKAPPSFILWNGSWGYDIPGPWLSWAPAEIPPTLKSVMMAVP